MNGYSKINTGNTRKSRSMDFSDFFSFPQAPKPSRTTAHTTMPDETYNQIKKDKTQNSSPEREDEAGNGERFGVVLGRCSSVSSSASGFQATMKRAFSMRRSSSVSERYSRIHDQYMAIASPIADEVDGERRSVKKEHRAARIFRACKLLLRL